MEVRIEKGPDGRVLAITLCAKTLDETAILGTFDACGICVTALHGRGDNPQAIGLGLPPSVRTWTEDYALNEFDLRTWGRKCREDAKQVTQKTALEQKAQMLSGLDPLTRAIVKRETLHENLTRDEGMLLQMLTDGRITMTGVQQGAPEGQGDVGQMLPPEGGSL